MQGKQWEVFQNNNKIAEVDKSDFSFQYNSEKISFDFAYITIHGTPGEDGILQAYFELQKIVFLPPFLLFYLQLQTVLTLLNK